ncbi:site-specific integrase [Clostridium beijerinckii]|uniref:site-specific integrase n=1 Tax=Clostridium beijerinckii TaxID=1520 RepID=UPI0003D2E890|nr:site-specific integrase [Clostridium beijerinckii]ALB46992.1 site-specific integrase [Clostridium beijerinckii NRRL B-598]
MSSIAITQLDDLDIVVEERMEFDSSQKQNYLNLFDERIKDGIIKKGTNFNDDRWQIMIGGEEYFIVFPDDIVIKKLSKLFDRNVSEFELAYKSFVLFKLNQPRSAIKFNSNMKRMHDLENAKIDIDIVAKVKYFIEYIKISEENYKLFENLFDNSIDNLETGERVLPEFEDIFKFSDIINDIVENKNLLDYKDYLLVIMWWKICSILPLRPSEFLRTIFNCIYEKEGEFYLKVKRSKGKAGDKIKNVSKIDDYYFDDTVNIDERLYNLIFRYKQILRDEFDYTENKELFPFAIIKNVGYRKYSSNGVNQRQKNADTIVSIDLRKIVDKFYKDIVEGEYGFKTIPKYLKKQKGIEYIEQTLPYDSRHIAIINLILIGSDVLEVMHLAGHRSVNTAYSYYNHIKEFSRGYALGYAKAIKSREVLKGNIKEVDDAQKIIDKNNRKEEANLILNIINGKKVEPKKVDGGYCHYSSIDTDKSFCFLYERNHVLCQYFVRDNKKVLEDEIQKIEAELDTDVKVLKDLINDMNGISKFNELYQTTSYRISKRIQELADINRKILMEEE